MVKHPKYRKMVLASLIELSDGKYIKVSGQAIKARILSKYKMRTNYHFKRHLKNSFKNLESEGLIKKIKHSYKVKRGVTPNSSKSSLTKNRRRIKKIKVVNKKKDKSINKKNKPKKLNISSKSNIKKKPKKQSLVKSSKKVTTNKKIKKQKSNLTKINSKTKTIKKAKAQRAIKHAQILNQPLVGSLKNFISNDNTSNNIKEKKVIWQYYDNNNHNAIVKSLDGWYDYDMKASEIVEEEWQKYIKNRAMCDVRAVKSGQFHYQVDFIGWNQQNLDHYAHTKRNIRRLDENGKITVNPYL